jgi:transcriptional regulator with XRE-family HTH domain
MRAEQLSTFGSRLRQYREAAGLSQEELAERAGLTAHAIGALERGERRRPYPHTVQLLASALGLDDAARDALIAAVPKRGMRVTRSLVDAPPRVVVSAAFTAARTADLADASLDPRRLPTTPLRGPALVGRREECAVLLARLAEAWQGRGGVVMLLGEAGIGKTRLARELAEVADEQGATVLWGSCFEGEWQPPYGPWVEALRGYTSARVPERLRRELGTGAGPISRLLPEIHALLPDIPVPSPLKPDEERYRLCDAVVQLLLAASAERPVLVVVDDLHWADADSLRLLRHLARSAQRARLLVIGVYRDPEVGLSDQHPLLATLASLLRETGYQRVPLRGLTHEEVATLLAQTAGQPLPQALVRAIEEETGGNPFYAGEVFRHLTEEAKLLRREGRWSTDRSIKELNIPEGVREVVAHRVGRLPRQTAELLRLASGLGGGFGFDVLAALSGLPEDVLLDCLDEALQAGLIRSSDTVPPQYEFAHAIVRHSLYESFSKNPDRRARLHRRIAHALEQVYAVRDAEGAAELAAQYHASAALPGASEGLRFALAAAEQARSAFAHDRVADLLHMAHDLARESPAEQGADILCRLAVAEAEAVRLEQARRTTDEALAALHATSADRRARAAFLVVVMRALKDGGADAALWEPLVERGLALAGDARDLLWARLALLRDQFEPLQSGPIGFVRWLGSDPDAVAIARTEGDEADYARTLNSLECRTRAETEGILRLARTWSTPGAVIRALEAAGRDLLYRHGAMREACEVFEELLAASERFGSIPGRAEALAQICTSQHIIGEFRLALETLRRAEGAVAQLGVGYRMHGFFRISRLSTLGYFLDGDWAPVAAELAAYATSRPACGIAWAWSPRRTRRSPRVGPAT